MVSPFKLIGYTLQITGMLIMFFGFFMLIMDIQKVVSRVTSDVSSQSGVTGAAPPKCDPKADELCGVDFTKDNAVEQAFSKKVYNFLFYLGIGLFIMVLGVIFRSAGEISAAYTALKKKDEKVKVPVGRWYGPGGKGPFSP
jgi:hypothetical protein